jgi:hypothetical protein
MYWLNRLKSPRETLRVYSSVSCRKNVPSHAVMLQSNDQCLRSDEKKSLVDTFIIDYGS